jgi:septal ring factor EnvC (AmiA/AmiB activator)
MLAAIQQTGVVVAIVLSLLTAYIQLRRWREEIQKRREADILNAAQIEPKRQTLIVAGAETAVAVLDEALRSARAEVERKDARIVKLEQENEIQRDRMAEMSETLRQMERQIRDMRDELEALRRRVRD